MTQHWCETKTYIKLCSVPLLLFHSAILLFSCSACCCFAVQLSYIVLLLCYSVVLFLVLFWCSAVPEMKWNESGFRPPLCTYRLNWARRTSWGWWDDWDDTVLQTQDSKFEPWRSEAEHATSRSRRLPTILTFTRGWGRNIFVSLKPPRPGTEPRTLAWKAAVLTTTLGPPPSAVPVLSYSDVILFWCLSVTLFWCSTFLVCFFFYYWLHDLTIHAAAWSCTVYYSCL